VTEKEMREREEGEKCIREREGGTEKYSSGR